jgi:hypothetical protein
MIQAGGETLWSEISEVINSIWSEEELPEQCKSLLLYQFTIRAIKQTVVNYEVISLLSTLYRILSNILLSGLSPNID